MIEIIRVARLEYVENGYRLLDGLSFEAYRGEVLGLTGLNGSGRTTVANILSGMLRPDNGTLEIHEKQTILKSIRHAQKLGIFCVRHQTTVFNGLNSTENFLLPFNGFLNDAFFPSPHAIALSRVVLSELNESHSMEDPIDIESMQGHLFEIYRAYCCGASAIICNDILRDFSDVERDRFSDLIRKLSAVGVTILLIDTDTQMLCQLCDRITVVGKGKKVGTFSGDELSPSVINKVIAGAKYEPATFVKTKSEGGRRIIFSDIPLQDGRRVSFFLKQGEMLGFNTDEKVSLEILEWVRRNKRIEHGAYVTDYRSMIFPRMSLMQNLTIQSLNRLMQGSILNKRYEKFIWEESARELDIPVSMYKEPMRKADRLVQLKIVWKSILLTRPKVLILDNCISGLDIRLRDYMLSCIMNAKREDIAIAYFAPLTQESYDICERYYNESE